jgi:hypothetical protein
VSEWVSEWVCECVCERVAMCSNVSDMRQDMFIRQWVSELSLWLCEWVGKWVHAWVCECVSEWVPYLSPAAPSPPRCHFPRSSLPFLPSLHSLTRQGKMTKVWGRASNLWLASCKV